MLSFLKKKIVIIPLIFIAITTVAAVLVARFTNNEPEYVTVAAIKGELTQSVEATGKIESVDRIELNFRTSGRISKMLVKVGDEVASGQILANLNSSALQSKVTDARARVSQEQADYDALIAGASDEDIQVTKDTIAQKNQDLATAQNTLINLEAKRDVELLNLKETLITTLNNEIITAETALEEVNTTLNDSDAKDTLGVKNISTVFTAKASQNKANDAIDEFSAAVLQISLSATDVKVSSAVEDEKEMFSKVITALDNVIIVLDSTITSSEFTEAELNALKDNIQSQQTLINTAKNNLNTANSNWTNKIVYYKDLAAAAEDNIKEAEVAVQVAESQLALKISPPRQFEINLQKARITQAQASLTLALANLEDAVIRAPINGLITKKHFEAGEQTSLSSPVLEMIGRSNLQIEVDIPESDVIKLIVGQETEITLDAFSDDKKFLGQVVFIDPAETIIQDVVYYAVKVQFDDQYAEVKPGMTANVTIFTDRKNDAVYVPFRAVKSRNGDKYVEVLSNGLVRQKNVALGMRGDEGVEIISGLEEGEEVVTFVKEK